jgi:hypothetical protein
MIARFVDRDMIMRYYYGLAVGHTYTSAAEPPLFSQSHATEIHDDVSQEMLAASPIPSESSSHVGPLHASESDSQDGSSGSNDSGTDPWEDESDDSDTDDEAILLMDAELVDGAMW